LIGYWIWGGTRQAVSNTAFNLQEQIRAASQKASAALAALKPGFSAQDLVSALNLNVINFPSGSAQIPPESTDYLNRVATAIKAAPTGTVLEIAGHTDNSGDSASNMTLSQQRAEAVRSYLVEQGVPPGMLVAKGYGDTRPVASNDTDEGRFRNRRIEFVAQ
jgi:OOP family OmpA-OmpF porin